MKIIVIDGEIGAGKTTIIGILKEYFEKKRLKVKVIPESPLSERVKPILNEYYQHPKENALKLQIAIRDIYFMEYELLIEETLQEKWDLILMDRSIQSSLVFMRLATQQGYLTREEMLKEAQNHQKYQFIFANSLTIFWQPNQEEIFRRKNLRKRDCETYEENDENVDLIEYMINLRKEYNQAYDRINPFIRTPFIKYGTDGKEIYDKIYEPKGLPDLDIINNEEERKKVVRHFHYDITNQCPTFTKEIIYQHLDLTEVEPNFQQDQFEIEEKKSLNIVASHEKKS